MKFYLETAHPIAEDSPDHYEPRGTVRDNSTNRRFNERLLARYKGGKPSILDFGCAGGGMVRTFLEDGCIAVGLEGSDANLIAGNHEWPHIPNNLFTVDLGYPFTLHTGLGRPHRFDVITAWEFLEHIPTDRVDQCIDNMTAHLKEGGLVIASISDFPSIWKGGPDHHQTRQPLHWWITKFAEHWYKRRTDIEQDLERSGAWVRRVRYNVVFQEDQW